MLVVTYALVDTPLGPMGLVASSIGLRRVIIGQPLREAVLRLIEQDFPDAVEDPMPFADLPQRLIRYSEGERVPFGDRLDLMAVSPFSRAVWDATRTIPYGQARSYGWVARQTGKPGAARAVGRALATNRCPIVVPCHRVVGGDGSLTGFSAGLEMKRRLMELEGV